MATPGYTYRAKLIRVVDGDTVVLCIDMGLRMTATVPIRLVGINCPETYTAAGKSAKVWAADWFAAHPEFTVTTLKDPEKYGRWLGVITAPGNGSLNDALVTAGHAVIWDGTGARPT